MFGNSYLGDGLFGNFFENLFTEMDKNKKEQQLRKIGVHRHEETLLFGIPKLEIPFKYYKIAVENKMIVGYVEKEETYTKDYYNSDADFLFETPFKVENLGKNIYLVQKEEHGKKAIHLNSERISDYEFNAQFGSRFKDGYDYTVLGLNARSCVINDKGEIVLENESIFNTIYLYGNLAIDDNYVTDLHSGDVICKKGYSSKLETDEEIFIEVDKQVFKINKLTCKFEVFGTPPKVEKPKEIVKAEPKEKVKPLPKQQRNDKCACGSGKKYKNCCGGK